MLAELRYRCMKDAPLSGSRLSREEEACASMSAMESHTGAISEEGTERAWKDY
jgi:hypothetical protein